jgi:serine/threonine-protein kinase
MSQYRHKRAQIAGMRAEYDIGSQMDNPHVVKALDHGVEDGIAYLVMELFAAPNLKQILLQQRQAKTDEERYDQVYPQIAEQAAEGLAYIHTKGWIHRDVKPHNFLARPTGETKLIDFSLAQKIRTGLGKLFGGGSRKIQGTRSYMSPEQIRGKRLDIRADVYSYGCTMFELFSGRPPYTGVSADELLMKHLRTPAPVLEVYNKTVTPEFSDLLRRTMAKQPEDRPKGMDAVLEEIRAISVYKATRSAPTRRG